MCALVCAPVCTCRKWWEGPGVAAERERWHSNTPWHTWIPEAYTCPVGSLSPERVVSASGTACGQTALDGSQTGIEDEAGGNATPFSLGK